jgi:hypothetical protein
MLTIDALLHKLKEPRSTRWVEDLAVALLREGFEVSDLLNLTNYHEKQAAFRAAWLLDTLVTNNVPQYIQHIDLFVTYMRLTKHHSCHRHYVRIFMYLSSVTADEKVKQEIAKTDMEPVVEQCFEWLINPKVKVAVKTCAAQTLFNLRHRYNWITEELQNQLIYLMKNGGPAIQATGRRLLNLLTID